MGPLGVVLLEPRRNHDEGLVAAGKPVMPEALLFQRPEEALDHPVLLWRVRRDVLLVEPVAAHDAHKDLAPNTSPLSDRRLSGAWPYSIRRSRSASSSVAAAIRATPDRDSRQPTIVRSQAVDDRRQMKPAVLPKEDVRGVDRPAHIRPCNARDPAPGARPLAARSLADRPADRLDNLTVPLAVDSSMQPPPHEHRKPPQPVVGIRGDQPADQLHQRLVKLDGPRPLPAIVERRPRHPNQRHSC